VGSNRLESVDMVDHDVRLGGGMEHAKPGVSEAVK